MKRSKKISAWMFHYTGKSIHEVKVIGGDKMDVLPCSNTPESKLRKLITEMYGEVEFARVEILPDNDAREC